MFAARVETTYRSGVSCVMGCTGAGVIGGAVPARFGAGSALCLEHAGTPVQTAMMQAATRDAWEMSVWRPERERMRKVERCWSVRTARSAGAEYSRDRRADNSEGDVARRGVQAGRGVRDALCGMREAGCGACAGRQEGSDVRCAVPGAPAVAAGVAPLAPGTVGGDEGSGCAAGAGGSSDNGVTRHSSRRIMVTNVFAISASNSTSERSSMYWSARSVSHA